MTNPVSILIKNIKSEIATATTAPKKLSFFIEYNSQKMQLNISAVLKSKTKKYLSAMANRKAIKREIGLGLFKPEITL